MDNDKHINFDPIRSSLRARGLANGPHVITPTRLGIFGNESLRFRGFSGHIGVDPNFSRARTPVIILLNG